MPSRSKFLKHIFAGGWAPDLGPSAFVGVSAGGQVQLPWLQEAQNIIYQLDGGPRRMPGCSKNFSSALESGAVIMGVYDAWFHGSAGSPSQHRILHVGTKIKNDDGDDSFADLFTGMTAGAVPCYAMLEDLLVMANDSGTDVPKSWDGSTAQDLAGSPPTFSIVVQHKNYLWAAGDPTNPSRLYYSVYLTPDDWSGDGSGYIDIDPSDGDAITGLASHRDELWVFKGPFKGAIHRISGSTPAGDDPFARATFTQGIGAVNQNAIVTFGNDLGFLWSDGTFRTLSATAQFGNYDQATASQPLNGWVRDHVNLPYLKTAYAVDWPEYGVILLAIPIDASQVPNCILMMDYRFDPARWAKWSAYDMATSLAQGVVASSRKRVILAGSDDGILRTLVSSTRAIDGDTTIPYDVQTPFLDYDLPGQMKTLEGASVCFNPKSNDSVTFAWSLDGAAAQTDTLQQDAGAVLGVFVLDTDSLGGSVYQERFTRLNEAGGEFRSVQYRISQNAITDLEIHSISAQITPSAESYENT